MPEVQKSETESLKAIPTVHWWWHDDDYVAKDTWNWLAVAEIIVAFFLYFWIASISRWPWLTVLSFIAVPLLLLRSKESVQLGVKLLKEAMENLSESDTEHKYQSKQKFFPISLGRSTLYAGLSFWLAYSFAQDWFIGHSSWPLYWRIALVLTTTVAITKVTIAALKTSMELHFFTLGSIYAVCAAFGGALAAVAEALEAPTCLAICFGLMLGAAKQIVILVLVEDDERHSARVGRAKFGFILWLPILLINFYATGLIIRSQATLTWPHIKAGLNAFSHNFYENVLISNIRHSPALIPSAELVDENFNVATLTLNKSTDYIDEMLTAGLRITITLVATIYRWNIKANSWIWWPLYLLLRPIQWEQHPMKPNGAPSDQRRTSSAFWSTGRLLTVLGLSITLLLGYLIFPHLPKDIQALQHSWVAVISRYLPSNWQSLRYWLSVTLLLALMYQSFCTYKMSTEYQEQLAKSDAHQKMTPDVEDVTCSP
jgi:hypothetical protein